VAERVAARLRSAGFRIWFDQHLPTHRAYSEVIEEQLDAARAVVVLWSAEAVASQWVRSEANRARESGRLVQLRLDDTRLPMPFDQIQCADLRGWSKDTDTADWLRAIDSIGELVGRDPIRVDVPKRPNTTRRKLVIGGGAAGALALAGFSGWRSLAREEPSPHAQLLLQKGLDALQSNDALETESVGSTRQAIALLTDATEADPRSATA
jgi:hypothetical protein